MKRTNLMLNLLLIALSSQVALAAGVVYQGRKGPGEGKHIVLIASDHEYRAEELLPAMGRILAKHYGFKCTVLFGVDDKGFIQPGISNIPGMEALDSADLAVLGLRFLDLPKEQMQPFVDYLDRAGPVVGIRTTSHGFKIPADSPFAKYSFNYKGDDYNLGFGRQVLGETWAGHYGKNHQQSTRITIIPEKKSHPVMTGVKNVHVQSGGYAADPLKPSNILAMAQPLNGMDAKSPPDETKEPVPTSWVRCYKNAAGEKGRVFHSTHGASEDFLNDGYRRMLINACLWAVGLEDEIRPDSDISFTGPYNPTTFGSGKHKQGVKPGDLKGFKTPILPGQAPEPKPKKPAKGKK